MSCPDDPPLSLAALHQRLLQRYKAELRGPRPAGPVFLIELAVSDAELHAAETLLSKALRDHPLKPEDHEFWYRHYLPLLRVATEVGYLYQGTGSDYWPLLEERLQSQLPHEARQELRHLFDRFAANSQVRVPATPWTGQFSNIARPITHALLPRELHALLLRALLAADARRLGREPWETLREALLQQALSLNSRRLPVFLEQGGVAEAVVRALALNALESPHVDARLLQRIRSDVLSATDAAPLLRQVAERTREPPAAPRARRRAEPVEPRCPLLLVVEDEARPGLEVRLPPSGAALSEARRRPIRLLGAGLNHSVDALVLGGRLPLLGVDLRDRLGQLCPLLPEADVERIASGALQRHLAGLRLDLSAPILFREQSGPDDVARQILSRRVGAGEAIWALTAEPLAELPARARPAARVCGLVATKLDPQDPQVQAWLSAQGIDRVIEPRARLLGGPPLGGRGEWSSGLLAGDLLLLEVERESLPVAGAPAPLSPGLWRCALPASSEFFKPGFRGQLNQNISIQIHADPSPPPPAVSVSLDDEHPTLDALLQRRLSVRFVGPLPLEGLRARLVLEGPRGPIAEVETDPLPALPALIPGDEPRWGALVKALDARSLAGISLRVEVGALASARWALPLAESRLWWDKGALRDGEAVAEVGLCWSSAEHPAAMLSTPMPDLSAGFVLIVPVTAEGEQRAAGRVRGPRRLALGGPEPASPARTLRRLRAPEAVSEQVIGARQLAEALARWSEAKSEHGVAEFARRRAALALEGWLSRALCGPGWVEAEARDPSEERRMSWQLARRLTPAAAEHDEAAWRHLRPEVPAARAEEPLLSALDRALRGLDRWLRTASAVGEPEARQIERAVERAWVDARRGLGPYPADAAPDPGLAEDELSRDLQEAQRLWRLAGLRPALLALVHPSELAWDGLATLPFEALSRAELAGELDGWLRRRPARPRGWHEDLIAQLLSCWLPDNPSEISDESLSAALADRGAARAIRYGALRWREARGLLGP